MKQQSKIYLVVFPILFLGFGIGISSFPSANAQTGNLFVSGENQGVIC